MTNEFKEGKSMSILTSKKFQKYFVPGIVFQSCVIAGGYGTGRELVVYCIPAGMVYHLCSLFCVCTDFQKI